jgi:hypothetical protein
VRPWHSTDCTSTCQLLALLKGPRTARLLGRMRARREGVARGGPSCAPSVWRPESASRCGVGSPTPFMPRSSLRMAEGRLNHGAPHSPSTYSFFSLLCERAMSPGGVRWARWRTRSSLRGFHWRLTILATVLNSNHWWCFSAAILSSPRLPLHSGVKDGLLHLNPFPPRGSRSLWVLAPPCMLPHSLRIEKG